MTVKPVSIRLDKIVEQIQSVGKVRKKHISAIKKVFNNPDRKIENTPTTFSDKHLMLAKVSTLRITLDAQGSKRPDKAAALDDVWAKLQSIRPVD